MKTLLSILLFSSPILNASAPQFAMGALWACQMKPPSSRTSYTCIKDQDGKRSLVKAKITFAKPNSLDVNFKVFSAPMKDVVIKQTHRVNMNGQEWIVSIRQQKELPVPTMVLFTVSKKTAFQFIVMAEEIQFDTIKREVQNAVAKSY